jgi:hypothetical protein
VTGIGPVSFGTGVVSGEPATVAADRAAGAQLETRKAAKTEAAFSMWLLFVSSSVLPFLRAEHKNWHHEILRIRGEKRLWKK